MGDHYCSCNKCIEVNGDVPFANTMNPTLTGGTAMALAYKGGVAVATDRTVFSGRMQRMENSTRQYRLNSHCLVTFSGDFADFQWLQNFLERTQQTLHSQLAGLKMTPKMVTARLSSFLYFRRSKMNPMWLTVIVCGMEPVEFEAGKFEPYIGVVQMRGDFYETKQVATDVGSMLLNQMLESRRERAEKGELSREEAVEVLIKAMEVSVYKNCKSGKSFDLTTIDADKGVQFGEEPVNITGRWDQVEVCAYVYP